MIARLLISPSFDTLKEEITKFLAPHLTGGNSDYQKHPDLLYFTADSKLGIEQARKIKKHFALKPYSAKGRMVVLEDASALTIDAQNTLLKTLEELPTEAILILGASSDVNFLPTVLSRCQVIRLKETDYNLNGDDYSKDLERMISSSIEERFEYVEKLKNKEGLLHFMAQYFRQQLYTPTLSLTRLDAKNFLQELLQAEKWANQNVNIRAILEYLMLVMPEAV